jgi:peptide/nickel transport system ATP-binding protein
LSFRTFDGSYQALDRISFDLMPGESLGIVGETGCGKSVTARAILGLLPSPPAEILGGEIWFNGSNLLEANQKDLRNIRGNEISMIFQDPMTFLNPVFTIGYQLIDVIIAHNKNSRVAKKITRSQAYDVAISILEKVQLPNPHRQMDCYPHQLSGGMRQRVLIAMALCGRPKLLIADEPTTALDVTIQAQILDLIAELRKDLGLSVVLITHDLGVVASVCDRVLVMYAGQVVENASVKALFTKPGHPYTRGLLKAVPDPLCPSKKLEGIPGNLPNLLNPPTGCRFEPRCGLANEACQKTPVLDLIDQHQHVACWNAREAVRVKN